MLNNIVALFLGAAPASDTVWGPPSMNLLYHTARTRRESYKFNSIHLGKKQGERGLSVPLWQLH
jgi:hypothetical protein